MVTTGFILLQMLYLELLEVRAVVLPQQFFGTAEKVMFMFWLWTVQVSTTNRLFYHLAAPRGSLRDRSPAMDLLCQHNSPNNPEWGSRVATHHMSCQRSLGLATLP